MMKIDKIFEEITCIIRRVIKLEKYVIIRNE